MLGNKKIEMMHFPSRLNMGIGAVTFNPDEIDEVRWGGFAILEYYLNDSIFMTGKYCYEYAEKVGCDERVLRLIGDTYGNFADEKKQFLKPNFQLSYTELNSFLFRDCIKISFPSVRLDISSSNIGQDSLENLSDLVLKANIKSLVNIDNDDTFSLNIFRVNNENLFQSKFYNDRVAFDNIDLSELSKEVKTLNNNGYNFFYFFRDKWDLHLSDYKYDE